ncbi:chemotaxis protein CheA [Photobacterium profundum]|uniref:Chemotaxis protein CheA n=1 Tax=Photobacterium profundum 3TCK TaxID=314280 RepID=Q1Z792_9GAMM|nr:chemotaxis protein CheA [Photobacterium profundum]EAS44567.1 Putative chemotaxis protein CheA [Photobacterium profundum 3TCK]PSV64572.1 chemotaxis protein CheA [Photobacterium profundum]
MSFDLDEDILQDFLIEAGEILELLSEQLVELERNPDDSDLLNAIFRGFHTVKGGAGFLSLAELVDACHGAENVFDLLRTGKRKITSELMDVILEALDAINIMFGQVQEREPLDPAKPSLLEAMHRFSKAPTAEELTQPIPTAEPVLVVETPVLSAVTPPVAQSNTSAMAGDSVDDMTQDEFDRLLDELHGEGMSPTASLEVPESAPAAGISVISQIQAESGDITDDEFERLLDELHGVGNSPVLNQTTTPESTPKPIPVAAPLDVAASDDDLMSDDEFERLLDELHGSGKGPSEEELEAATKPIEAMIAESNTSVVTQPLPVMPTAKVVAEAVVSQSVVERKSQQVMPEKVKPKAQADSTVRVDTATLDNIMNMVGELVLVRNRLVSLGLNNNDEDMSKAVANLDVVTADLQGAVMKTRMQPIKKVFGRFPRVVRDLARTLKKDIVLEMRGEETDLDKNLVEALADPLVHLVRNSVDHGIEMPDVRAKTGKPSVGTVLLSASQEGDHILLTIEDDGGGMDADRLRAIAVERGVMDADSASRISDNEAYNLIFAPGFSTKKEISDISGRGVGMDVVKTAINQLNGSIYIDSALGKGTRIDIKVPLTLAILPTLMVGVSEQPFALPLASVNEIFHLDLRKTNKVDGQLTIIVREKAIPLFYLQDWLSGSKAAVKSERVHGHVVIVQIGHQRVGFVVDTLIGQEEVVIKPLDDLLQGTPGMAGATITSDGHIALILDVPNLLKHYAGN